ncbi:MAG: HAD hydrolase-like protein [Ferruginibacter sp.]
MRRSNIQLVVFDIAGTTVKENGTIAEAFKYALHQFGYTIPFNEITSVMGYKKSVAIGLLLEKFYPAELKNNPDHIEGIHAVFIDIMVSFYENDTALQPMHNAEYVFSQLQSHNIKVALNTGFSKKITDTILKRFGWNRTNLIDFVISSDEVKNGRPSPEMIQTIMQATGITDPAFVAKVGDTEVDILEGRNAGCGLVVGISTGAYTRNQLIGFTPDAVIDDISELPLILNSAVLAKHIA